MNSSELILSVAGTAIEFCLCLLLIYKQVYREFPTFCVYAAVSVIGSVTGLSVRNMGNVYFYVYWIYEFLSVVLTFFALQEIFHSVFRNFYGLKWFKPLFPGIGISMLVVAFLRTTIAPPTAYTRLAVALISLEITVQLLQFGLFGLFVLLVRFFRMRWHQYAFGIMLGFGIAAGGSLVAFLLRSEFGKNFNQVVRIVSPLTYIIGVVVWLITFLQKEPKRSHGEWNSALTPEQMISDLRRYTRSVRGALGR